MSSSESNFVKAKPFPYDFKENSSDMTEISIEDKSNQSDKDGKNARPATLTISSPFGPPGATRSSIRNKNVVEADNDGSLEYPTLTTPRSTPLDAFKEWSITAFKCTKQLVNEKLGKCQRTVDIPLETDINQLRETQKKYLNLLRLTREMTDMYANIILHQILIYESLSDLSLKEPKSVDVNEESGSTLSLSSDFRQNAEMLRLVTKNGDKLILALRFFTSNLSTLVNKTIEDTMMTIRNFEQARLEYDAERYSVANLLPAQAASVVNTEKLVAARAKYERLKEDVAIKLKFLEENKAKVMHKQLILFHNAFTSYASGNVPSMDSTLKQFSVNASQKSWLEK